MGNVTFPTPRKSPGSGGAADLTWFKRRKLWPVRQAKPGGASGTFLMLRTRSYRRKREDHFSTLKSMAYVILSEAKNLSSSLDQTTRIVRDVSLRST